MSFEEPTQRLSVQAAQTTTALPRPLDLAGPTPPQPPEPADKTGELSLDEIFADAPPPASEPQTSQPQTSGTGGADQAPTWTAMPVIPVRSEPSPAAAANEAPTPTRPAKTGPSTGERLRSDAAAAWEGALRRSRDWLTHDDNGLMLMTAVVACILIFVVAAVGS